MSKLKALFLAAVVGMSLSVSTHAAPGERGTQIGWKVHQPTRFMVSGILRKDGSTDEQLYHVIVEAPTEKVAVDTYVASALASHPGYKLVGTLATPVPPAGSCENNI
ncbi:hypothetical protein P3T25_005284 [Paraburkholderia sp. GAS32]